KKVTVYVKLKDLKNNSAYRNLSGNYEISLDKLPPDCFVENLDSRLARLAIKLSRGWHRANELSVFVTPVVEGRNLLGSQTVSLAASLKNLKGSVLASAEENIPKPLIKFSLEKDEAETLAQIAD